MGMEREGKGGANMYRQGCEGLMGVSGEDRPG